MQVPPKINQPAPLGLFVGMVLGAAALGTCAVVFFFNPKTSGFYPGCLFHQLTGLNCPGCGGTRALYALLHGNFLIALRDNAVFVLTLPLVVARGGWLAAKFFLGQPAEPFVSGKTLWIFLGVLLLFGVVRNLPGFEWLSPA